MLNDVVSPKQQRSIEKRNKILTAGAHLFSQKGYYHTNTAEIAKEAGVSTGIIYRYFPDKKAIFLEAMGQLYHTTYHTFLDQMKNISAIQQLPEFLNLIIDHVVNSHSMNKTVFEEMEALSHYDADVAALTHDAQEAFFLEITDLLPQINLATTHPHEKLHVMFNLIESYAHELVYSKEECKDYTYLKDLIIRTCISLIDQA